MVMPRQGRSTFITSLLWLLALSLFALATPARTPDAPDQWLEVHTAHFVVSTNASERDGRHIANQFERVRAMFHQAFPTLRVDPSQPIAIIAARNESTMKAWVPEDWEVPGHLHPAGLFRPSEDKDYVVLRLDAEGTNSLHIVYHEYTHVLLHLNFIRLPLWLDEGICEFFGNSALNEKGAHTGAMDPAHLYVLRQKAWLPLETLFAVDNQSPYYNEKDPASLFYAESWAVVHFLLLDPEARRQHLLASFLSAWEKSGNQNEAARATFGDLRQFSQTIQRYTKRPNIWTGVQLAPQEEVDTHSAVRALSTAETLILHGDFLVHRDMAEQAQPFFREAARLEPNLVPAHEALGRFAFEQKDFATADAEMQKALELGSTSFLALYYHGLLLLRDVSASPEVTREGLRYLEKAASLNPDFAPTFEALTEAYSRSADTQTKALDAAAHAAKLDPGSRSYEINLIYALLNNGRVAEAKPLAEKLLAQSSTEPDIKTARSVLDSVEDEEAWRKESEEDSSPSGNEQIAGLTPSATAAPGTSDTRAVKQSIRQLPTPTAMAVDGSILTVDCVHVPEVTLTLSLPKSAMSFHIVDFGRISVSGASAESTPGIDSCTQWTGRRIKIWFRLVQGQDYLGEISKIYFF
jgi:tetratricopeptide (TPR) repeat protein